MSNIKFEKVGTFEGKKVAWVKLGEVTDWDKRFAGLAGVVQRQILSFNHCSAAKLKELAVEEGDVELLSTGNYQGKTTEDTAGDLLNDGEVITIPTGGSANLKYHNGRFVDSGNNLGSSASKNISLKYIYHYMLQNNEVIARHFRGSGVKHPSMPDILNLEIPIPLKRLDHTVKSEVADE